MGRGRRRLTLPLASEHAQQAPTRHRRLGPRHSQPALARVPRQACAIASPSLGLSSLTSLPRPYPKDYGFRPHPRRHRDKRRPGHGGLIWESYELEPTSRFELETFALPRHLDLSLNTRPVVLRGLTRIQGSSWLRSLGSK